MTTPPPPEPLWQHPSPESTHLYDFMRTVNAKHHRSFRTYAELHRWSVSHVAAFWEAVGDYVGIRMSAPSGRVVSSETTMFPRPEWFGGGRLNFAENLLFPVREVDEEGPAMVAVTETAREVVTWKELRDRVGMCQRGMRAVGVGVGDRVAGYVANHSNAVVASLAASSLGAIWTAVSPDTGVSAVLDRMLQIEPVLLFTDNAVRYNAKTHPVLPKVREIVGGLSSLHGVVVFDTVPGMGREVEGLDAHATAKVWTYEQFAAPESDRTVLSFAQLPPDAPVYIVYSSGTTGAPKCLVHGAIGTLLQHKKEHILQSDIRPGDKLFYFTTCTWMMWHWLVSGLAAGATLVLYDGSPFQYRDSQGQSVQDDLAMPKLIEEIGITQFGTSAKYLSMLEQRKVSPQAAGLTFTSLKAIYSTGSPLAPSTFHYVYRAFGSVHLASITGGTDIISLFGAPCPLHPVYAGEIQVLGLGMAVEAWASNGTDVSRTGEPGDLVCTKPFPSQPVMFWKGADGEKKYRASYFEEFEAVWHHGDFVRMNPHTGGLIMLGRSDGVLKPSGVRFGSAELYNVLLKHFPDQVEDALAIGRRRETDDDETVVMFLKLPPAGTLDAELVERIRATIRKELSARHVPGVVDECPEIPVTSNGKKMEKSVKQILCGWKIPTSTSVANPESLEFYRQWAERHAELPR